jgi:dipeptide/tripeptide permease
MASGLHEKGDERREHGCTIFYMGIHIGGMLAAAAVRDLACFSPTHYRTAGARLLSNITDGPPMPL